MTDTPTEAWRIIAARLVWSNLIRADARGAEIRQFADEIYRSLASYLASDPAVNLTGAPAPAPTLYVLVDPDTGSHHGTYDDAVIAAEEAGDRRVVYAYHRGAKEAGS